jgi:hypothetical protein
MHHYVAAGSDGWIRIIGSIHFKLNDNPADVAIARLRLAVNSTAQARRLLAGARHIFGIAAAVLMNALRRQLQHAIG